MPHCVSSRDFIKLSLISAIRLVKQKKESASACTETEWLINVAVIIIIVTTIVIIITVIIRLKALPQHTLKQNESYHCCCCHSHHHHHPVKGYAFASTQTEQPASLGARSGPRWPVRAGLESPGFSAAALCPLLSAQCMLLWRTDRRPSSAGGPSLTHTAGWPEQWPPTFGVLYTAGVVPVQHLTREVPRLGSWSSQSSSPSLSQSSATSYHHHDFT